MTALWKSQKTVRLVRTALDFAVLSGAHYVAFALRFDGNLPAKEFDSFLYSLPYVLLVQYLCMVSCKVSESSWEYVGLVDVRRICLGLSLATTVLLLGAWNSHYVQPWLPTINLAMPPRWVVILDLLLGVGGLVGLRILVRAWHERVERNQRKSGRTASVPTFLIGAGSAGLAAIRQVVKDPQLGIQPIGFLDDDPKKHGMVIHGARVLGPVADMAKLATIHGAKQVLITIGKPAGENLRRIVDLCKKCAIPAKVIPGIRYILEGKVNLSAIREVAIEDLLNRDPVDLDLDSIAAFVNGRRVLITGAGGSIGSELCRIVCRYGPAALVLVEHTENNLFYIHHELTRKFTGIEVIPCLADICDRERMEQIFSAFRPNLVLHAAAHKHVPMIEWNPGEALKNNVQGTKTIADLAHRYEVGEFVMISTDKAVNPTSVMGATKRVAEIYIQALSQRSKTRFVAVRFGNVLGSAGSVIPTFKEQIARGGPVTVTHPDMKRYFMTIPEACQLVLQAATMGRGGEIFILDMGLPVRIVDLARNLISLCGLAPDDIEIRFTGLRPGEKLYEELALQDEIAQKTRHPKIFIGRLQAADWGKINRSIEDLQALEDSPDISKILRKLKEILPEFERNDVTSPQPAVLVRSDSSHLLAGINGNGKSPAHDAAKNKKSSSSHSGIQPVVPIANGKLAH